MRVRRWDAASGSFQWGDAHIAVDPDHLTETLLPETTLTRTVTVTNVGQLEMNYDITQFIQTGKKAGNRDYCDATNGCDEFIARVHANCSRPEAPFESLVEAQVKWQVQGLLRAWLEEDVPEEEAKIAATAASWAIYGLALAWSQDKKPQGLTAEQFAQQILPLIALNLRGVSEK